MALFHSQFFSETLGMQTGAVIIVPQAATSRQIGIQTVSARTCWPCLWLLHGLSDDHTVWSRRTSIERYADAAGCAVVMPSVQRSFYTDMAQGAAYWHFLSEELPMLIRSFFPISDLKRDNAVAGLSMGGYGALKWLLRKPDMFYAGASLSGALDIVKIYERVSDEATDVFMRQNLLQVFGQTGPKDTEDDLFYLMRKRISPENCPPIWSSCGREDSLFSHHQCFEAVARSMNLPITAIETGGGHTWDLWDTQIQQVLGWLKDLGFGKN
jgi:S-formylglutathione hydrolase FrmB